MLMGVYSVYDSKAKAYLPPFFMSNDFVAVRVFADCANDAQHQFCKFGADFTLFKLGTFNDENGVITSLQNQENLGLASSFFCQRVIEETQK